MLDIRLGVLDVKTSVSLNTSSTHPHVKHPPGRPGHVETGGLLGATSTHVHVRQPPGHSGHVKTSI
eukprot:6879117-Pyramimonas_sp.AAC.1